ncbi:hypothetical protein AGMMS50230_06550 [Spirochaetia bacterium]|nr:hypothetical protein AGMMS50230_06550 [Spirochaetia bacterium]
MVAEIDPVIANAVVKIAELSEDEIAQERAESREKFLWDQAVREKTAYENGIEIGVAQGILETARNFKVLGLPIEQIAVATGLSVEEITRIS